MTTLTDSGPVALTMSEALVLDAATARIVPSDELGPGAREAGAAVYIDRSLAGHHADRLEIFQAGLAALDRRSRERAAAGFADAPAEVCDAVLAEAERGETPGGDLSDFFTELVALTRQGMFCDPAHGGNHDKAGWKLLGVPAFQPEWDDPGREGPRDDRDRAPLGIADLAPPRGRRRLPLAADARTGSVGTGSVGTGSTGAGDPSPATHTSEGPRGGHTHDRDGTGRTRNGER